MAKDKVNGEAREGGLGQQQEILGKNWTKEVGSWKVKENIRNEFYQEAARLKFDVGTNLDEAVKHPESEGLKTQEELKGKEYFKYRVKEGKNERLYNILDAYFKKIDILPADREKEIAISLYCLTRQGVNVDLVVPSWKVEIQKGQLSITKSTGELAVNGAYLRTIPGVTDKVEKSEEKGRTYFEIPGVPPVKPPTTTSVVPENKSTKPKKAKSEPKASDILERI